MQNALENIGRVCDESGASVTHDPLPRVVADEAQLTQLFEHLVGNAIKFKSSEPPPRSHLRRQM